MSTSEQLLFLLPWTASAGGGLQHTISNLFAPPPLHPILVHFTAALLPASLGFDLFGRSCAAVSLRHAGAWCLFLATIATPVVAASGWIWLWQLSEMDHSYMLVHQWLGTALAVMLIPLLLWRWKHFRRESHPSTKYLVVCAGVVGLVMLQGHLGGMMTFGASLSTDSFGVAAHVAEPASQPADEWKDHLELKE